MTKTETKSNRVSRIAIQSEWERDVQRERKRKEGEKKTT